MSVGPQAVKTASKHWILILRLQLLWLECPDRYQFTSLPSHRNWKKKVGSFQRTCHTAGK